MDTNALIFSLFLLPGLITTIVVAANAKKINARSAERRAARKAARLAAQ